jgi:hypothetical protein
MRKTRSEGIIAANQIDPNYFGPEVAQKRTRYQTRRSIAEYDNSNALKWER